MVITLSSALLATVPPGGANHDDSVGGLFLGGGSHTCFGAPTFPLHGTVVGRVSSGASDWYQLTSGQEDFGFFLSALDGDADLYVYVGCGGPLVCRGFLGGPGIDYCIVNGNTGYPDLRVEVRYYSDALGLGSTTYTLTNLGVA